MGSALFYHLTRSPAEALLPVLIDRARAAGWRVELRGTDADAIRRLDDLLWQGPGFVAHGIAGGPHDDWQPVLLRVVETTPADPPATAAGCLIALDGAPVTPGECAAAERVCIVFDGNQPDAVEAARGQWRALTAGGVAAEYWSDAEGRWTRPR